jgi:DNA-binding NarL/FixJ family response regulator
MLGHSLTPDLSQNRKSPEGCVQVIAEASDGSEAIQKAEELKPDLIVLDAGRWSPELEWNRSRPADNSPLALKQWA